MKHFRRKNLRKERRDREGKVKGMKRAMKKEGKKNENRHETGENTNLSYNTDRFCRRCKKSLFVANHKILQISTNLFFKRKALPKEFFVKSRGFLH